jgi:4-carboxymuconolactone decarboxylase
MPRLPEITEKESLPEQEQPIFDAIAQSRGRVGYPFSLLLYSPEVAGRVASVGHYVRFDSVLSPAERELAVIVAARESDCAFEWAAHSRQSLQVGVRQEAIDAVANRAPVDSLTPDEALIITYGREVLRDHRVSQETFDAALKRFGEKGMVDLIATLGYFTMIACALNAFEVPAPEGSIPLP